MHTGEAQNLEPAEVFDGSWQQPTEFRDESRSNLVFRILLFQFKLFADGIRDLILSPLSLFAGLLGLLISPNNCHFFFDRLLKFGRGTDRWINLFENYGVAANKHDEKTLDDVAHRLEEALRKDYRSNGMSAKTMRKFEEIIAEMKSRRTA